MKKLIPALIITGMMSTLFTSCGPSAEEKAAAEQRMRDSIAAVEMAKADSIIAVQQKAMEDSLAIVKATEDSLAAVQATADSLAAVKANKPKSKPKAPAAPATPKVGSKKPGAK